MIKSKYFLTIVLIFSTLILLFFSSLRLNLFGAGVDLGFFDQLLYLQSQGLTPVSTIIPDIHLIGDHFALVLYPIAILYKIIPSIYWLLIVQAFALSLGAVPVYLLSKLNGISEVQSRILSICYVLYPSIFNINFYTEFRTETIAVPLLIWAVYFTEKEEFIKVFLLLLTALSCKEVMSLNVIFFAVFILLYKKNYKNFLIISSFSAAWFLFANYYIIPNFRGGASAAGIWYFSSLGDSLSALLINLVTHPWIIIQKSLLPDRLFYYVLLLVPVVLGLSIKKILFFLPAIPTLLLNILSDDGRVRDLIHQYSLPIIPFLFIWLIYSISEFSKLKKRSWAYPKILLIWSICAFLALAKYGYFPSRYFPLIPYNRSVREAMTQIDTQGSVLTSSYIANHLSHRSHIYLIRSDAYKEQISTYPYQYILVSFHHLDTPMTLEEAKGLLLDLKENDSYNAIYEDVDKQVFLFKFDRSDRRVR